MPFPNPATQFKPGQSGHPGRAPGRNVSSRLRDLLEKGEINGKPIKDGRQVADLLTEVILKQALGGDYRFVQMVLDRTEGKVADVHEVTTTSADPALETFVGMLRDAYGGKPGKAIDGPA